MSTQDPLPQHIAIIMDGNGRWARRRGMPRIAGHKRGVESVRALVKSCARLQIPYLTLFAFSSENWRRPSKEVSFLTDLLMGTLEREVKKLHEGGVNLRIIGDVGRFGSRINLLIDNAHSLTSTSKPLTLTVAINYGGKWDLVQASRRIAARVAAGELQPEDITEDTVTAHLSTAGMPEPDLFIRTGGEQRISNFLLWQLAYTELYFTDILWPDFGAPELDDAIASFKGRERRFGQTGDQVAAR